MAAEAVESRSLKLRVKLLRAKLLRALEEAKVRSVAAEVKLLKLKSRSISVGKKVSSSMIWVHRTRSVGATRL